MRIASFGVFIVTSLPPHSPKRYRCDVDCSEYLARYIKSEQIGCDNTSLLGGNEGVTSSLALSLDVIQKENLAAWETLRVLAWIGPDNITRKLLRSLLVAQQEHEISVRKRLREARTMSSLIEASNNSAKLVISRLATVAVVLSAATLLLKPAKRKYNQGMSSALIGLLAVATATAAVTVKTGEVKDQMNNSKLLPQKHIESSLTRTLSSTGDVFEKADQTWNILKSFSLLVVKEGNGSIHRLLAQALRASQNQSERQQNLEICLRALLDAWLFKPELVETWQDSAVILEHVKEVVRHIFDGCKRQMIEGGNSIEFNSKVLVDTANLSRDAGVFSAMVLNRFKEAQESLQLSLQIIECCNSERAVDAATARSSTYHELGRVYRYEGLFQESQKALESALDIRNELTKTNDELFCQEEVASTLHELGVLEVKKHNLDDAANFLRRALDLRRSLEQRKSLLKENHEAASTATLHQLAAVYLARKPPALEIAQSLLNEALSLKMQIGQRAATLKQLARVEKRWGNFSSAERRLNQALELYQELYGEETPHINVAAVKFQQGALAFQQENYQQARGHFGKCLQTRKVVYGYLRGIHIEVSAVLHELGCVAIAQKLFRDATDMLTAEKEILDQLSQASHNQQKESLYQARLTNLTWLRKCAKEQGDEATARSFSIMRSDLKRALNINKKSFFSSKEQPSNSAVTDIAVIVPYNARVNLLQQEAIRSRLIARQYALLRMKEGLAGATSCKDSLLSQLVTALKNLCDELQRCGNNNDHDDLYNGVLEFHTIISKTIDSSVLQDHSNQNSTILTACDRLRNMLREQGFQVVDSTRRNVK